MSTVILATPCRNVSNAPPEVPTAASKAASNPGSRTVADRPVGAKTARPLAGAVRLAGHLVAPERAIGVVPFARAAGAGGPTKRRRLVYCCHDR
jgi:hypothetical protein